MDDFTWNAFNAQTGKCDKQITINGHRLEEERGRDQGAIKLQVHVLGQCLDEPSAIFQGIRSDSPKGLCYAVKPTTWFKKDGTECDPPKGFVFCVYLDDTGVAYEWRPEPADEKSLHLPQGFDKGRFHRQIFPEQVEYKNGNVGGKGGEND